MRYFKSVDRLLIWAAMFFCSCLGVWSAVGSQQASAESAVEVQNQDNCLICTSWMPCQSTTLGYNLCIEMGGDCIGGGGMCGSAGTL